MVPSTEQQERKADVVKVCHCFPEDAPLERERELQRTATRAGESVIYTTHWWLPSPIIGPR